MPYHYPYPRPAVTSDCVIFRIIDSNTEVLLIQRAAEPFKNSWAFPGGFLEMDETLEECAKRELEEETCLKNIPLYELGCFSKVDRDPRGRVITIAFWGILGNNMETIQAKDDAKQAAWFDIRKLPPLAFDHTEIMSKALDMLKKCEGE